jgi:putative phosphoesterase
MRIGIVSDTHNHVANAMAAADVLSKQSVEAVLHCGDIGGPKIVEAFAAWPTHYVLGNTDDRPATIEKAILAAGQTFHKSFGDIQLANRRIALLHGDDSRRLAEAITSQEYDLVCSGHTHVPAMRRDNHTLVLNPGALYRARPHTIAIVDLTDMTAKHITVPTNVP